MAQIYARAFCTIIAYDGVDSASGLRGLPMLSGSTKKPPSRLPLQDTNPVWSSRGWTYQEDIFSTRKIKMARDEIRWRCTGSAPTEDNYWSNNNPSSLKEYAFEDFAMGINQWPGLGQSNTGGLRHSWFPSLDFYRNLIFSYTSRAFTKDADVDAAFRGMATALKSTFPGGFIQGLPRVLFDRCLLWNSTDSNFQRRTTSSSGSSAFRPASWSWMGWKGKIWWVEPPDQEVLLSSLKNFGMVEWSYSTELDSIRALVTDDKALQHFMRWSSISESNPVPEGWQRKKDKKTGEVTYTHPEFWQTWVREFSFPPKPKVPMAFSFPFPVGEDLEAVPPLDPDPLRLFLERRRPSPSHQHRPQALHLPR